MGGAWGLSALGRPFEALLASMEVGRVGERHFPLELFKEYEVFRKKRCVHNFTRVSGRAIPTKPPCPPSVPFWRPTKGTWSKGNRWPETRIGCPTLM